MGKFVIKTTDAGCHFVLKADNGEVIATSQVYKSKESCKKGIETSFVPNGDVLVWDISA